MLPTSSKKPPPPPSEAAQPQNTDDDGHLLAIDPSVLHPLVRFRRTSLMRTYHETYGRGEYDRSSIRVDANRLALPKRGERVYHDEHADTDVVQELGELAERCKLLSVTNSASRSGELLLQRDAPYLESDEDKERKNMLFKLRRPGTPLPTVFLDDSDSEDEAEILPSSVKRSRLRMELHVPELEPSDGALSDDSEGPTTPPANRNLGFTENRSKKANQNTTTHAIDSGNSDGCLDGF